MSKDKLLEMVIALSVSVGKIETNQKWIASLILLAIGAGVAYLRQGQA